MSILVLPIVSADVIVPGSKTIGVCSRITNYDSFPDYIFLTVGVGINPLTPYWITNNSCIKSGYKFSSVQVYAVEKIYKDQILNFSYQYSLLTQEDFDKMSDWEKGEISKIKNGTDSTQPPYSEYLLNEQQIYAAQFAIKNNYHIYKVDANIRTSISSTISDTRTGVEDLHKIIKQENGSFITKTVTTTNNSTPMIFLFFVVPIISLGAIIYLFFKWRKAK